MPLEVRADCPVGASPGLAALQRKAPMARAVMPDGQPVWLVTGYHEAKVVLADRRFSAVPSNPGYPLAGGFGLHGSILAQTMQRKDPPEHTRMRKLVGRQFTPARIASFQPIVDAAVEKVLDDLAESGDAVIEFGERAAKRIPAMVTDEILGIPAGERTFFQNAAAALFNVHDSAEEFLASENRVAEYLRSLLSSGGASPDGIIAQLVRARESRGQLTDEELVAFILHLVVAGHETTTNQMLLSLWSLLTADPPEGRRLSDLDDTQWAEVVEELLRFHAIVRGGPRRAAIEDVEVGGVTIRAGEGVYVSIWTANHDASVYPTPASWKWAREASEPEHLAFGHGLHQCLGQYLARAELRATFRRFFHRFPDAALDGADEAALFGSETTNYGMHKLLVRLAPA